MKKYFLLFAVSIISFFNIYAQASKKIMSVADMHKDIDYFYEKLLSIHPYPFLILSQEEWAQKTDSLKGSITQPKTKKDFFLEMTKFNAYLDLHSGVHPSAKIMRAMEGKIVFPKFEQQGDSIFFEKNSEKYLLLSVGKTSTKEIKKKFLDRNSLIEPMYRPTFLNMLRAFCNYNLVEDDIEYTYEDNNGKIYSDFFKRKKNKNKNRNKTGTSLQVDTTLSVAVMRVNTFAPTSIIDFRDSIYSYFKQLKNQNIKRLYIDITNNSGGLVILTGFLSGFFIESKDEIYAGTWTAKSSEERDTQRLDFFIRQVENGDYTQRKYTFSIQNSKPKFSGEEVFVIQSRNSYSASAVFASLLQHYCKKCKIIGEEGEIKAFYADPLTIVLPKSKFIVSLSSMFGRFVGKEKDRGVVPDIPYSIYDPTEPISLQDLEKIIGKQ